jgi:hypothetical protein
VKYGGKLVALVPQPGGFQLLKPCEYGKWTDGTWYGCTPNGHGCNLGAHKIEEHADGTITVSPSIRVSTPAQPQYQRPEIELWHGWLEHGVWRDC